MITVEITRPGRFGKFEGKLMRSQHLDAGAQVEYPNWYARQLIESGWAVEVKAQESKPETEPEQPRIVAIDTAHPFFEIANVKIRQVNALLAAGYATLDDLDAATDDALLAVDAVGPATVARIRRYLRIRQ